MRKSTVFCRYIQDHQRFNNILAWQVKICNILAKLCKFAPKMELEIGNKAFNGKLTSFLTFYEICIYMNSASALIIHTSVRLLRFSTPVSLSKSRGKRPFPLPTLQNIFRDSLEMREICKERNAIFDLIIAHKNHQKYKLDSKYRNIF